MKLTTALFTFVLLISGTVYSQPDGEKLFKINCSACHTITDKKLIGPGLAGIQDRWEDQELLYSWIKNSQDVISSGDPYANKIFEEYNKSIMPAQAVSDEDITAILDYIANPPVEEEPAQVAATVQTGQQEGASGISWVTMLIIVVLLFALFVMLRNLKYTLKRVEAEKQGLEPPVQVSMLKATSGWIDRNKTFFSVIMIVVGVSVAKAGWDWLFTIGVYEGYAPEQPIKFSHKTHAGAQKIDCNYCHSSARNSKTSGIPSANVCMNCHKFISEGPTYGTEEISKIYNAIGWDPQEQTYTAESTGPIKWVKVHNLPDHAYFNHSQHVTVGNIECQTCHGPVEEMEVVRQHADLTMGWCINCHRESRVNDKGNGYYEDLHKRIPKHIMEEMMKDGKITVSEFGGIECAKCHY